MPIRVAISTLILAVATSAWAGVVMYNGNRLHPDAGRRLSGTTTLTVSGAANIDDNYLHGGSAADDQNNGGSTILAMGGASGDTYRTVIRIATASIPAGSITGFRIKFYHESSAASTGSGNIDFYIIKNANAWVEGTQNGAAEVGSSDYTHTTHATASWAGSAGCGLSGTDYDADASPPTLAYSPYAAGVPVQVTVTLPAAWALAWKQGTRTNNGFLIKSRSEAGGQFFLAGSSDDGTNPVTFEFDYSP